MHGNISKKMNKLNDCNISVTTAFPFPRTKDPRTTRKNPKNSANHPSAEMWILIRWRRCRICLEESESNFRSFTNDSL